MKEFSSPNYPKSSAHYLDCEYSFQAEIGYRVELSLEVDTEECCDFLDVSTDCTLPGHIVVINYNKAWCGSVEKRVKYDGDHMITIA